MRFESQLVRQKFCGDVVFTHVKRDSRFGQGLEQPFFSFSLREKVARSAG
jgi:hypothetical protein